MTQFTGAWAPSDSASSRFTRFLILRPISYDPRKKLHKNSRESANGVVLLASLQALSIFIQRNFRDRMTIDDTRRILSERRSSVSSLARACKLAFHVFYIDLPPYTLVTVRDIHAVYIYCSAFELIKEACKLSPPPPFSSRNSYSRGCRLLPI